MSINMRIRRVVFENKAQYIGSILLIVFSCFTFTLMSQFAANFERLAKDFQRGYMQEDASFITERSIDSLQELEAEANAVIEEGGTFDYKLSEGQTLRIFSWNERVNLPAILEGEELGTSMDILISPTFAAANNYKIGDELIISDRPFTITGFMTLPNYIYPIQSEMDMMPPPGFGIAVISKADFAALSKGSSFYAVKFKDAGQNTHAQSLEFKELLKGKGIDIVQWTDIEDNKRVNIVAAEVDILNIVSKGLPIGILLLASIMVCGVISRMINREAAIIGALYALGYRKKEIYRHYLMFPLLIAVTGGTIGTILGSFPVRRMAEFMLSAFIMPLTGIELSPGMMIISPLLPILFLTCSGYLVIRKELKHSPVELMRGKKEKSKVNFLERTLKLEKLKFSMKFKIREQLRSLSRLAFLLAGVAVATMLLLWGFALKSGFDYMLSEGSLTSVYQFKYEYKFNSLRTEPLPAGAEPGSSALFLQVGDDKKAFYVAGISPDSEMVTLMDASGASLSTDKVIVTKPLANQLKLKKGETVDIVRKLDGRIFSVKVDSVADTYAGKFMFMPLADFNEKFELPEGSYNGVFSNVLLDVPANEPYVVVTLEEKIAGVKEAIAPTQSMIGGLAALAFIIGVIVIYIVTTLIVEENRGIISLMKVFGYRKREINSLILNSSTIVVVVGYSIGIPLILAALGVLVQSLENSVGLSLPPLRIDLPYILFGFVVVMLSYELSKLMCRKKVRAVSMSEALKTGME